MNKSKIENIKEEIESLSKVFMHRNGFLVGVVASVDIQEMYVRVDSAKSIVCPEIDNIDCLILDYVGIADALGKAKQYMIEKKEEFTVLCDKYFNYNTTRLKDLEYE